VLIKEMHRLRLNGDVSGESFPMPHIRSRQVRVAQVEITDRLLNPGSRAVEEEVDTVIAEMLRIGVTMHLAYVDSSSQGDR
jgi:hypothetical protein